MSSQIVDEALQDYRSHLDNLLYSVQRLTSDINHAKLRETVENLRKNINEPFLLL
jgi:hypothetical protein